jgi:cysteine desulfurase
MSGSLPIYLDYNATTPVDRRVAEEIRRAAAGAPADDDDEFSAPFGNPSSLHAFSKAPKELLSRARRNVSALLGCFNEKEDGDDDEIIFESGGSESINHCIKAVVMQAWKDRKEQVAAAAEAKTGASVAPLPHVVTTSQEHVAVLETCKFLESYGFCEVSRVGCNDEGVVSVASILDAVIPGRTVLVSVMLANNEVGTLQPVKEIVEAVKVKCGDIACPLFHTDASQCLGKLPFNVRDVGVDFLTVAGHKLYAPKGIGLTYVKASSNKRLPTFVNGAGQEKGRRAGTENLILIAALGKACELCLPTPSTEGRGTVGLDPTQVKHSLAMRDRLALNILRLWEEKVIPTLPSAESEWPFQSRRPIIHGPLRRRIDALLKSQASQVHEEDGGELTSLPNTLSIAFPGCFAAKLVALLADTVAVSAGAACHPAHLGDPKEASVSHVLSAMKVPKTTALCTLRLSVGRWSTEEEMDCASQLIIDAALTALKHRSHASLKEMAASEHSPQLPLFTPTTPFYLQDTYCFSCEDAKVVAVLPAQVVTTTAAAAGGGKVPKADMSSPPILFRTKEGAEVTVSGPPVPLPKSPEGVPLAIVLLDRTVAHPQGGGQPSDRGVISFGSSSCVFVFHAVRKGMVTPTATSASAGTASASSAVYHGEAILHYGAFYHLAGATTHSLEELVQEDGSLKGDSIVPSPPSESLPAAEASATIKINSEHRRLSAKLHSAGHLLDLAVRRVIDRLIQEEDEKKKTTNTSPAAAASAGSEAVSSLAAGATTSSTSAGTPKGKGGKAPASADNEELKQLVPGKGYHFNDGPYVEYEGSLPSQRVNIEAFGKLVEEACKELLEEGAATAVSTITTADGPEALAAVGLSEESVSHLPKGSPVRVVAIGGATNTCPCGGTHVKKASEIGSSIVVTKVTSKKGKTKVSYTLA